MADVTQAQVVDWLEAFAATVEENTALLTRLDSAIGDADHGANLNRGMKAVTAILGAPYPGIDALAKKVGMTLVSTVGGASGPLLGTFFLRFASAVGSTKEMDAATLGRALRAGAEGVVQRGRAARGDKTMIDVWLPALDAYDAHVEEGVRPALEAMGRAADEARDATAAMVARKGRASYLGDRSRGHIDPGAASSALLIAAAARTLGVS